MLDSFCWLDLQEDTEGLDWLSLLAFKGSHNWTIIEKAGE